MKPLKIILPLLFALLALSGCVAKGTHEATQNELQACQDEKLRAEATIVTWEQRFDRESERWESLGDSVESALPQALSEFEQERQRIVELVPEQVRGELEAYLEEYFRDVAMGFSHLSEENAEIRLKLDTYSEVLQSLQKGNQQIAGSIDGVLADERAKRTTEKRKRDEISTKLSAIVAEVSEFDSTVINCQKCPERLRLSRKERETLSGFHSDLMTQLSELQTFASDAAPVDGWDADGE